MKLTELETAVLERMVAGNHPARLRRAFHADAVTVMGRELTGAGFLTELQRSPELRLFEDGVSIRLGTIGARLNRTMTETGYVVYVDDGYVTSVEGYTYGDEWPTEVETFELYELRPGMELQTRPR